MKRSASKEWRTVQLGTLCDVCRGSSPRPIADQRYFDGGTIPWIKIADATKSGKYLYTTKEHVNEFGASFSRQLPKGSLIIAASGTLGYPQFLGVEGCAHDGWLIPSNYRGLDKHFLYYLFLWKKEFFYSSAYGAAIQNINTMILREMEVCVPDLPTQNKIAGVLSAYDDLIENNTRRIAILEETAQAIYREWFVNFRFPGHENAKLINSPLGKIPEGWKATTLGEVVSNFDRLRKPLSSMQRADMKGEYPYYGAAKIFDYINNYIFEGKYLLVAEDGSVITPDRKPVLQMAYGKFWVNNHTHILQGKPPVCTEHLCLSLSFTDVSGYVTGAAQPKITQANMNRMPFLVATDDVQAAFTELVVPLFDEMHLLDRKNANLRTTRDLLLPKLIGGHLDVEELDIDTGEPLVEATT